MTGRRGWCRSRGSRSCSTGGSGCATTAGGPRGWPAAAGPPRSRAGWWRGQHKTREGVASLPRMRRRSPCGIASQPGKHVIGFHEKPLLPHWLNAGVYVLNREFLEACPEVGDHEAHLFPELAADGKLYAFRSRAWWKAIDTVKDLQEAEKEMAALAAPFDSPPRPRR